MLFGITLLRTNLFVEVPIDRFYLSTIYNDGLVINIVYHGHEVVNAKVNGKEVPVIHMLYRGVVHTVDILHPIEGTGWINPNLF